MDSMEVEGDVDGAGMVTRVRKLDAVSARRLGAQQVVSDLTSAVKELLENALDAGAKRVDITLENAGARRITVADDGGGMSQEDLTHCCELNTTSKVHDFSEVAQVKTLGFRGQGLHGLCALSAKVEVTTRTAGATHGWRAQFDSSGQTESVEPAVAASFGTTVVVHELFATMPVRRQQFRTHLKTDTRRLEALVAAYSLSFPQARILLRAPPRPEILHIPAIGMKEAAVRLLGSSVFSQMKLAETTVSLEKESDSTSSLRMQVLLPGHDADPKLVMRASAERQYFALNRRPIDLPLLSKVLNHHYRRLLEPGLSKRYPAAVVQVWLTGCPIDVNVSPDKRLVFLDPNLQAALADTFLQLLKTICPVVHLKTPEVEVGNGNSVGNSKLLEVPMENRDVDISTTPLDQFNESNELNESNEGEKVAANPGKAVLEVGIPRPIQDEARAVRVEEEEEASSSRETMSSTGVSPVRPLVLRQWDGSSARNSPTKRSPRTAFVDESPHMRLSSSESSSPAIQVLALPRLEERTQPFRDRSLPSPPPPPPKRVELSAAASMISSSPPPLRMPSEFRTTAEVPSIVLDSQELRPRDPSQSVLRSAPTVCVGPPNAESEAFPLEVVGKLHGAPGNDLKAVFACRTPQGLGFVHVERLAEASEYAKLERDHRVLSAAPLRRLALRRALFDEQNLWGAMETALSDERAMELLAINGIVVRRTEDDAGDPIVCVERTAHGVEGFGLRDLLQLLEAVRRGQHRDAVPPRPDSVRRFLILEAQRRVAEQHASNWESSEVATILSSLKLSADGLTLLRGSCPHGRPIWLTSSSSL